MHRMFKVSTLILFIIILSAFISPLKADVRDLYCYLEANVDVKVEVWSQDNLGNKGQRLWKGFIKQGDRQLIRTRYGRIRYASSVDMEDNEPLSGDRHRWCEEGETIGVP